MKTWSSTTTPGNRHDPAHPARPLSHRLRAVFIALLIPLLGPATASWSAAPEEGKVRPFRSLTVSPPGPQPVLGERLEFEGRWLIFPVGHGWLEGKELVEINGRQAYHIEAHGYSNDVLSTICPIHDVVHSYLDAETLRPLRFEKHQHEGRYHAEEIVTFDDSAHIATYRSLKHPDDPPKQIPLPAQFQDLISTLYWFRRQPLTPNSTMSLDIYTDEKIYQTAIQVGPPMILQLLKRGAFPCLMVEPKASFKGFLVRRARIWAYLTADQHRLPLLIKATTPWGPMSAVISEASLNRILKRKKRIKPSAAIHPVGQPS